MAARQTSPRSLTSIAGALLLALGFLFLFSNLGAVATQVANVAGTSGGRLLEMLPALILAVLHGAQSYFFDHAWFLSGVMQILVSFWPLILIIVGAVLLGVAFRGRFAAHQAGADAPARGDRS